MPKAKIVERSYDQPNIAWKEGQTTTKIFILDQNETLPTLMSSNYNHKFRGPGIIVECVNVTRVVDEYNVNDNAIWGWISKLIAKGNKKAKVLTLPK